MGGIAVIDYLGHTVESGEVRIPEVKVKALKGWCLLRPRMVARESHLCSCLQQKHATSF